MAGLALPTHGDRDRAPTLLAIFWAPIPIILLLMSLRFYVRVSMRNLGLDDWSMLLALIFQLIAIILLSIDVAHGGVRHIFYLSAQDITNALKYSWVSEPFAIMGNALGKSSVAFLLMRLIGRNTVWRKWFLYVNVVVYMVMSILAGTISLAQCEPTRALWENVPRAKCWPIAVNNDFRIFQSIYGAFLDFCLALFPITIIWNLKLNMKTKTGLCALLGLGIFAGICGATKAAQLPSHAAHSADFTWDTFSIFALASAELSLVIICGCIPTVKPLYDLIVSGKPLVPNNISRYPSQRSFEMQTNAPGPARTTTLPKESGHSIKVTSTGPNNFWSKYHHDTGAARNEISVQHTFDVERNDKALGR